MAQEIITLENLAAEIAKLRGELATWKALAIKQDRLSTAQMLAVNSGATAGKIAQIATNTSDIAALQQIASSAFRVVKVAQLPASGESYIMYLVPQTDGETLNYCNEYLWIDNAWELVGTTGAMANNGELQIIVNGVTVGTFTANQAANSTASITVPTDTSQLTNGAGYVDATALATALASKQDSLSLAQLAAVNSGITSADVAQIGANTTAIAGKQDALTTSQLAAANSGITSADVTQIGTNTGNIATNSAAIVSLQGSKQNTLSAAQLLAVNSGITSSLVTQIGTNQSDITTLNTALGQSLTPSADDTYSLGGASFRYANVYAVTFTGDLTGTASKAIADEDGTSIKTGYVNVAGNQTVSGQKTWSGNQFFTSPMYPKNTSYEIGNTPASNVAIPIYFTDKNSVYTGYVRSTIYTSGRSATEIRAKNAFKNGVLDPTGSDISSNLNVEVQPSGAKTIYWDGLIRNDVTPYTTNNNSLGTSTNQWSSVYAQSYYYNGVEWGLDKANNWTGYNTFTNYITSQESAAIPAGGYGKGIAFRDYQNNRFGYIQPYLTSDSEKRLVIGVDSGDIASNSNIIPNANNTFNLGTSANQWSSVYAQTYYYNGTAWGLDKANVWGNIQTVTGNDKGWNIINPDIEKGVIPSANKSSFVWWADKNNNFLGRICSRVHTDGTTMLWLSSLNYYKNGALDPTGSSATTSLILGVDANAYKFVQTNADFRPDANNTSNLGTSTNKWKTLNGINPGALGLPSAKSTRITIDTTNWDKTNYTLNSFTPQVNGWMAVLGTAEAIQVENNTSGYGSTFTRGADSYCESFLPIGAGDTFHCRIKNGTNVTAYLYPCLGNV